MIIWRLRIIFSVFLLYFLLCPELIDPFLIKGNNFGDLRSILAVNLISLANPAVNFQNLIDFNVGSLQSSISNNGPHIEFTLALRTVREMRGCFLNSRLSSQAIKTEKVIARELNGILIYLKTYSTPHLLI
jgi:hypothetical protein